MANKKLKTIQFPGLPDTYTVPQVENGTNNNVAALDGAGNVKDSAIEVSKVAKTDGSYQNLNAGTSDQLNATVGVIDKVPYNFRTSGGSADIGNRLNDKIVGGTIVWNQLFTNSKTSSNGVTISNNQDGTITLNGTSDKAYINFTNLSDAMNQVHKYLLCLKILNNPSEISITYKWLNRYPMQTSAISSGESCVIRNQTADHIQLDRGNGIDGFAAGTVFNNVKIAVMVMDLTQMFGSTIADYIYSLEQATAGAGVAWFKNLFPKPYYKYNASKLMNVCTNAHITRGFNAYNHANGTAKLVGGKQYQITGAYTSLAYSTGETISPDASGKFTPTENGVLTVTGGNATNTCVHLVWSGYRNGEYEPYVEHNYPLSPIELRGIPKLDASNNLYFDGDTYEKDGTVTRRYGIVDLGTLNWSYVTSFDGWFISSSDIENIKKPNSFVDISNIICAKYITTSEYGPADNKIPMSIAIRLNGRPSIRDSNYSDATSFKAALSGVYLVYELETPATETSDPFADPQIVDDFGTEEYVDALTTAETSPRDVAIPVGHETFYQANLRDKLQNLPVNASADGLYLVKQTGNKQELIVYAPESELPTSPAETGTYVLKLVDGTLTWVLES